MSKKIISIHQPYYFPWINYFSKIEQSDVFVFLDCVQYEKNNFYNRNYIKNQEGRLLLTVPVSHSSDSIIRDVLLPNDFWQKRHYKSICYNYSQTNFFNLYKNFFEEVYINNKWEKLFDLNRYTTLKLFDFLGISTKIIYSSELGFESQGSDLIFDICKSLDADIYLSGKSGKSYLDLEKFRDNNVEVRFQKYYSEPYNQPIGPFIPNLSIIDFLMNCHPKNFKNYVNE